MVQWRSQGRFWGLNWPHWLRGKEIFDVEMLHFPFVTRITFNIMLTKFKIFNINSSPQHKLLATPLVWFDSVSAGAVIAGSVQNMLK